MASALSLLPASASGGLLVMTSGGLMGPRLMLAPAGTRLPPGVHAVAAVPAAAASGHRRAMLVAAGATGGAESEPGSTAGVNEPLWLQAARSCKRFRQEQLLMSKFAWCNALLDYLYLERKNYVIQSWEFMEHNYRADAYFGDVKQFGESASNGIVVLRKLLDKGKDYSSADMTALSFAGQCFYRVALQAKKGYVQDATVVEAVQALQLVCHRLLITSPAPSDPSVVPYDAEVYFKELSDAVADFIDGATKAVEEGSEA